MTNIFGITDDILVVGYDDDGISEMQEGQPKVK